MISVLIVEDNIDKLYLIKRTLCDCGIYEDNILSANCVVDAVKLLASNYFDLMVLDLSLPIKYNSKNPRVDAGVSILRKLESNELNVPTAVVGLTSYSELQDKFNDSFKALDFNIYDICASDNWMQALRNKITWLDRSKYKHSINPAKKVIVTIHGINTAGEWQGKLSSFLNGKDEFVCKNYKYINKSPLLLFIPFIRKKLISNFLSDYEVLIREFPSSEFYFFAHSFGTYILAESLTKLDSVNVPRIRVIALAGSVLNRDFRWSLIKRKFNIDFIYNDCGVKDFPLIMSYLFVPGLGMAGRTGFYGFENDVIVNRFFDGGHSFFEESESFYTNNWLPLLESNKKILVNSEVTPSKIVEVSLNSIKILVPVLFIFYFLYCLL